MSNSVCHNWSTRMCNSMQAASVHEFCVFDSRARTNVLQTATNTACGMISPLIYVLIRCVSTTIAQYATGFVSPSSPNRNRCQIWNSADSRRFTFAKLITAPPNTAALHLWNSFAQALHKHRRHVRTQTQTTFTGKLTPVDIIKSKVKSPIYYGGYIPSKVHTHTDLYTERVCVYFRRQVTTDHLYKAFWIWICMQ